MIAGLARFLHELRREGVPVSPAEWLDGLRALERLGVEQRSRVRAGLRATLVKRAEQGPAFDRAFERC
ncbi:MAG TPA: hypothetical protein VJS92_17435, partial [Candidatus Polarisedimenticolaceae bacterium]|nr:hypothetical protein [Candidatus Polarisedimenticolaceae bacterium]